MSGIFFFVQLVESHSRSCLFILVRYLVKKLRIRSPVKNLLFVCYFRFVVIPLAAIQLVSLTRLNLSVCIILPNKNRTHDKGEAHNKECFI